MRYLFTLTSFHTGMVPIRFLRPRHVFTGTMDEFTAYQSTLGSQRLKAEVEKTKQADSHCGGIRIQLFPIADDGSMGMNTESTRDFEVSLETGELVAT